MHPGAINSPADPAITLLRSSTAGSVDDGKSTLVGRLLHDSKNLLDDQLVALERASAKHGQEGALSLALVTDGLRAEREQGITIDVAYRYFSTPRRRFILADTPGHEQYTRNMATGASTTDLTIVLMDAGKGLLTQTCRHSFISALLGVPRILVAVNKMDLVDFREDVFLRLRQEYIDFAQRLGTRDIRFVPISAMFGDNVVKRSEKMPWYHGESVLEYLENVYIDGDRNRIDFRFPVQLVIRAAEDYRGYAGQISSGSIRCDEEVLLLPSMRRSRVRSIVSPGSAATAQAGAGQSVVITLSDELDVSRGDMLVRPANLPKLKAQFEALLIWMHDSPMDLARDYLLLHTTRQVRARLEEIRYRIDVNTLSRLPGAPLNLNEIGRVALHTAKPLFLDTYERNRATGNFIVIDPATNATVAAGMIIDALPEELLVPHQSMHEPAAQKVVGPLHREEGAIAAAAREQRLGYRAVTIWCTGLSGSGKSTIACRAERRLFEQDMAVYRLDGDNMRHGLNSDLGFSNKDRAENIRRAAEVARLLNDAGVTVFCSFISPFAKDRARAREIIGPQRFLEVFVATPLEVCEQRDPHGLYARARRGEIKEFTGVSSPYEEPAAPDLIVRSDIADIESCVAALLEAVRERTKVRTEAQEN